MIGASAKFTAFRLSFVAKSKGVFLFWNMVDQIEDLLRQITHKLSNDAWFGKGPSNYVVDAKIFCGEPKSDLNEIELIENLIPKSIVGDIEKSDLSELIDVVKGCFEFSGDEGSHPNRKYLVSDEFKDDLSQLLEKFQISFSENKEIFKFRLKDGHPFYPVYWDYAFFIKSKENNCILIASSSD